MKSFVKNFLIGMCMGVVSVIPGISGGTMALITGAFDKIVDAMRQLTSRRTGMLIRRGRFKEFCTTLPWLFIIALVGGIIVATAFTANLVLSLLENHATGTYAFFLGLVVASLPPLARRVTRWNTAGVVSLLAGAAAGFYIITRGAVDTPDDWWMLMIVGAISACSMILPGISGSLTLMLLGKFDTVWGAVAKLTTGKAGGDDILTLVWIVLGGLIGLALFAHLLFFLLSRLPNITLSFLTGLMSISLWKLWPWQFKAVKIASEYASEEIIKTHIPATEYLVALAAFAAGAGLVWLVEYFAGGKSKAQSCQCSS